MKVKNISHVRLISTATHVGIRGCTTLVATALHRTFSIVLNNSIPDVIFE